MTKFYFHVRDGDNVLEDRIGLELPNVQMAREEAEMSARDMLIDNIKHCEALDGRTYEVWSDAGEKLFTLPFRTIVDR